MIWAALFVYLAFLFAGSPTIFHGEWLINDSKREFKQAIQDKERSKKTLQVLDEMISEAKRFNEDAGDAQKSLEKLVKDYHSTREDFNQLFSEIQAKRLDSTSNILNRIPDLKKNVQPDEWAEAFKDIK